MDSANSNSASPRPKSIWPMFVGAFLLFLLFGVVVQWLVSTTDKAAFDEDAIRAKERYEILAKVKEENAALTTGYAWADRAKGTVRIPLDRALELAVASLSTQGQPRPAYPIDPATAMGAALKPGGFAAPAIRPRRRVGLRGAAISGSHPARSPGRHRPAGVPT